MVHHLELLFTDCEVTSFGLITFVDQKLPFSQYLPRDVGFPDRVDTILGSDLIWDYFLTCTLFSSARAIPDNFEEALVSKFGKLWLSSVSSHGNAVNCVAASQPAIVTGVQEKDSVEPFIDHLTKLTPSKEDLVKQQFGGLILSKDRCDALKKLEDNPLCCTSKENELTKNISDEQVLANYQVNVRVIKLENG